MSVAPASRSSASEKPPVRNADRLDPGLLRCLHVPRRVADQDRVTRAGPVECRLHEVGVGLRRLHVVLRRPGVHDLTRPEDVEKALEVPFDRGAREHDDVAARLQVAEQLPRALERCDLVEERVEERRPAFAQRVAEPLLGVRAGHGLDVLVAAHPDAPVEAPERDHDPVLAEGARPAERVVVVRVDECPVDVEDDGARHRREPCPARRGAEPTGRTSPSPGRPARASGPSSGRRSGRGTSCRASRPGSRGRSAPRACA